MNLDIIDWLLSSEALPDTTPLTSVKAWKKRHDANTGMWSEHIDKAVAGGFLADRIAYAFAAGYNAALQKMVPSLPLDAIAALCVTEKGGGHPRAIKTRLEKIDQKDGQKNAWQVSGFKQFATSVNDATHFLIAASTGTGEDGKNRIRLLLLEGDTKGLCVEPMKKSIPFIPELDMGCIRLENVEVGESQLLPGDGYSLYIKPFRTIEDLHITGAMLGYIYRISCLFNWPCDIKEQVFFLISALKPLTMIKPDLPHGHIAMGGLFQQMGNLLQAIEPLWEKTSEDVKNLWHRDKVVVNTADKVRAKRLETAWGYYANP